MARPCLVEPRAAFVGQDGIGSARVRGALEPGDEAIGDEPIHEPGYAGAAEQHPIGELVHAEPVAGGQGQLEQDVEFGQGQLAAGHEIRLQAPRHAGVRSEERPPGRVLEIVELGPGGNRLVRMAGALGEGPRGQAV